MDDVKEELYLNRAEDLKMDTIGSIFSPPTLFLDFFKDHILKFEDKFEVIELKRKKSRKSVEAS